MKLRSSYKLAIVAALGLAFSALAAHAQLIVNVSSTATFGTFVGGTNNSVTNNGVMNSSEVISTGLPALTPFTISYSPVLGPNIVTLNTGTLNVASLLWHSPVSPTQTFSSVPFALAIDFDSNGVVDVMQNYVLSLTPFTSPNGLTGINYAIVPINFFGSTTINGDQYAYASAVANANGTLFDGSNTTSLVQFQFILTAVPEPSTYALIGVLALGAMVIVRRRMQGAAEGAALS